MTTVLFYADLAERKKQDFLHRLGLAEKNFVLVTIHRDSNTDDPVRLYCNLQHPEGTVEANNNTDGHAASSEDHDSPSQPRP